MYYFIILYLQAGYDGRDGYNYFSLQYTDFFKSNADQSGRWVFRANRLPGIQFGSILLFRLLVKYLLLHVFVARRYA